MRDSALKPTWPEGYGFKISGSGPSYVVSVDRGGVAYRSGLSAGDELVEVDGRNVSDMSANAIKSLTRRRAASDHLPTLNLVSRVQYKEVLATTRWGYGLMVRGLRPTTVTSVDPPGPAYAVGIREGDIILEVNGKELKSLAQLESILQTKHGNLRMAILPRNASSTSSKRPVSSSQHVNQSDAGSSQRQGTKGSRAHQLFFKLNQVLGSDYQRKMTVVGLIKKYAEDRDIEKLGRGVSRVLVSQTHRQILTDIRSFVPLRHRSCFDRLVGGHRVQSLSISTTSHSDRTHTNGQNIDLGSGLLAIATHRDILGNTHRSVHMSRQRGGFGLVLRGHRPVCVERVLPDGPAGVAGLQPGDQIMAVNWVDVRKCSHSELVEILQSSGNRPLIQVKQTQQQTGHAPHPLYTSDSAFSHTTHHTGSSWLQDSGVTLDGHSFRQKVELLLTDRERATLRLALIEYNINRNISQLVDDVGHILDTPAKQGLWLFILNRMSEEHQGYISKYVDLPQTYRKEMLSDGTLRSGKAETAITKSAYTTDFLSSGLMSSGGESQPMESFKQQPIKSNESFKQPFNSKESFRQPMKSHDSFKEQIDYLLTPSERSQLQRALQTYSYKKNLDTFIEEVCEILATASKQTLWFHLLPRLDPHHRAKTERRLGLPWTQHHDNNPSSTQNKEQKHQSSVFPKYGDILHLQKQFVGDFLSSRNHHQSMTEPFSSDEDLDDLAPLHSDSSTLDHSPHIHTPSSLSSEGPLSPHKKRQVLPVQGRFGPRSLYMKERNYSSDVEQATMVLNPIYAEIDHSRGDSSLSSQTIPKVRLVRESAVQTTPVSTPLPPSSQSDANRRHPPDLPSNQAHKPADFRTIVKVYEGQHKSPDIVTVFDARNANNNSSDALDDDDDYDDDRDETAFADLPYTNIDDFQVPVHTSDILDINAVEKFLGDSKVGTRNSNTYKNASGYPSSSQKDKVNLSSLHQSLSHAPHYTNLAQVSSDSSDSLDSSYQSRALDALKVLDDVVGNASLSSDEEDDGEDGLVVTQLPTPAPPPPPPPPPQARPVSTSEANPKSSSLKLNVKRINWEKIHNPSENTVWARIEHDAEDLEEMVRYLELEQQFSAKQSKATESFRDRKSEQYILSPKKAYNISILLGHLKKDMRALKQALLDMNEDILTAELLQQLLQYLPDNKELALYAEYRGGVEELSQPDQFMFLLTRVPRYEDRLRAISFKLDFSDKVRETSQSLRVVRQASAELQQSSELSRVLEVALAMGNYINQGSKRVGQAAGFRLAFLQRVDLTKTSDGKGSFLSVLAKAVWNRYPEAIAFSLGLPTLHEAVKVSLNAVEDDLKYMKNGIQEVSDIVSDLLPYEEELDCKDRFQEVMERFLTQASDELQSLYSLQQATTEDLIGLLTYFGEDPNTTEACHVFHTISDFSTKFERARQKLLLEAK